jgi:hypothetical protein
LIDNRAKRSNKGTKDGKQRATFRLISELSRDDFASMILTQKNNRTALCAFILRFSTIHGRASPNLETSKKRDESVINPATFMMALAL